MVAKFLERVQRLHSLGNDVLNSDLSSAILKIEWREIQGTATRALVRMSGGSPEYQAFLGKRGNMEAKKGES